MATTEKSEMKAESKEAGSGVAAAPARERDIGRDKAIDLAVSTIEKQFGKGSIMRLGEGIAPPEVKVVPTGSLGLDIALGVGGVPRGRVIEIYGPESSGKTTLALHVVGEAQKLGGICAFVDAKLRTSPGLVVSLIVCGCRSSAGPDRARSRRRRSAPARARRRRAWSRCEWSPARRWRSRRSPRACRAPRRPDRRRR